MEETRCSSSCVFCVEAHHLVSFYSDGECRALTAGSGKAVGVLIWYWSVPLTNLEEYSVPIRVYRGSLLKELMRGFGGVQDDDMCAESISMYYFGIYRSQDVRHILN
jgi:hypothetical protein